MQKDKIIDTRLQDYRQELKEAYNVYKVQTHPYFKYWAWQSVKSILGSIMKRRFRNKIKS